jgi:hypothetical protein
MRLAAGAAVVTLLGGGAGAFAATQLSSNPRQAYINDVASRLNVTPTALTSAMKQARIDQINAAEKAGKLTAAQAGAAKSWIESGHAGGGSGGPGGPLPGSGHGFGSGRGFGRGPGPGPGRWWSSPGRPAGCGGQSTNTTKTTKTTTTATPCHGGPGFGRHAGRVHNGLGRGLFGVGESAVTGYLGITSAALRADLAAGKSLAQIASATSGKSISGLKSALTAAYKTRLDKAVSAGWMTAAQEASALSALSSLLPRLISQSFELPAAGSFHSLRHP